MNNSHYDIPIKLSNNISELIRQNTLELLKQGYSMDSITVYFEKSISVGLYKAEVDTSMTEELETSLKEEVESAMKEGD